jgi:hypothetical protein
MDFGAVLGRGTHPDILRFAQYCTTLAEGRAMPRRRDFDPFAVFPLLGNLVLIDLTPPDGDYRIDMFGVHLSVLFDNDLTLAHLSEIENANLRNALRSLCGEVAETGRPVYSRGSYVFSDGCIPVERLLVPLAGETEETGQPVAILGFSLPSVSAETLVIRCSHGPIMLIPDDMITAQELFPSLPPDLALSDTPALTPRVPSL